MAARTVSKPLILLYIPKEEKRQRIMELCGGLRLETSLLTAKDAKKTIGELAGYRMAGTPGRGRSKTELYPEPPALYELPELLIFSGVQDTLMDRFLADYKAAGIPPVGLKAKVTPYNVGWSLYQLAEELKRERTSILLGG